MLELGISQAQAQFTKILGEHVVILDKKTNQKKAVLMPYDEYNKLVKQAATRESLTDGGFSRFVGALDKTFASDDARYNEILK
ncbi:MAG: hypothetical protein PHE67_03940 [Campylobacterales bacterium]|nr:hypothetical protein [Campylobacterales bacterium]